MYVDLQVKYWFSIFYTFNKVGLAAMGLVGSTQKIIKKSIRNDRITSRSLWIHIISMAWLVREQLIIFFNQVSDFS